MKKTLVVAKSYLWLILTIPFIFPIVFKSDGMGHSRTLLTTVWNTACEWNGSSSAQVPISFFEKLQVPAAIVIPTAIFAALMVLTRRFIKKTILRRSLLIAISIPLAMAVLVALWLLFVALSNPIYNEIGQTISVRENGECQYVK